MTATKVDEIRAALQQLAPESLEIEDESAAHAGHAGAREGGHFRVQIVSAQFRGRSRVQRHQLVYSAVGNLKERGIHALAIEARAPEELG